jgi:hypothetical protein
MEGCGYFTKSNYFFKVLHDAGTPCCYGAAVENQGSV